MDQDSNEAKSADVNDPTAANDQQQGDTKRDETDAPNVELMPKSESKPPSRQGSPQCSQDVYRIKYIEFRANRYGIVTQNHNGPCPLIAIINVLSLRNKIHLPTDHNSITAAELVDMLGNVLLEIRPRNRQEVADHEQNVMDAMSVVLPKLPTGLDVNVKFLGVDQFEFTTECTVFDLLNISLYHGWLVDPQQQDVIEVIGQSGYNQLVEKIIEYKASSDEQERCKGELAQQFLDSNASQLTYYGICELHRRLKEGELAVLFRNNHFSTILKHKKHVFSLVTDQGFLHKTQCVWETLSSVEGDDEFCDGGFHAYKEEEAPPPAGPAESADFNEEHDYLLALSLQQQEEQETRGQARSQPAAPLSDYELAKQLQAEEQRLALEEEEEEEQDTPPPVARSPRSNAYQPPRRTAPPSAPVAAESPPARGRSSKSDCRIL